MENVRYTQVAAKAVSLAELFDARFEHGLDGPVRFRVEMSAPDGPSTAGGKQALQHIRLLPDGGGPAIVIGSANTTRQTAEIRTFEHVAELFAQRFKGGRVPIDVARYRELAQGLAAFFRAMKMTVTFSELEAPTRVIVTGRSDAGRVAAAVVVGVIVAVAVLAMAYYLIFVRR